MNVSINYEAPREIEEYSSIGIGTWTGDYAITENEYGDLQIACQTGSLQITVLSDGVVALSSSYCNDNRRKKP